MQFSVSVALSLLLAWCSLFSQVAASKTPSNPRPTLPKTRSLTNAAPTTGSRRGPSSNYINLNGTAGFCTSHSHTIAATSVRRTGITNTRHRTMNQSRGSATKFPYATGSRSGSGSLCSKHNKSTTGTATGARRTGITNTRHRTMNQTRGSATKFPYATGSRSGSGSLCSKHNKSTTGTGTGVQRTVTSKTKPTHTISTTTITSSPLSAKPNSTSQSTEKTSTTISASPTGWANVTCDSKYATDATMDKAKRWAGAHTDDAWHAAVSYWKNKGKPAGLQFSQAISDFFKGPQEILCADLSSENGCNDIGAHVCTDFDDKVAGYFIVESLIMIASKILAVANAVVAGVASFDQGTFTNTWAPNHSTSKVPEILMALLGTLFVAVAGPMLDQLIVHFGAYTTQEIDTALFQLNRDLQTEAEIAVDDSLTVLKTAGTAGTALAEEEEIESRVQSIANQFANALNTSDTNLFNGSDASIANLYTYIRNGSQLETTQVSSDDTLKNDMLKIMYAYTIPLAWNLTNSGPFILDTETDCKNGKVDVSNNYKETYLGSGTFPSFCYKNRGYYLASAYAEKGQSCDSLSGTCDYESFYALDGVKDLDGSQWEGITGENIINGSLNSFFANGEKNGGYSPNLSTMKEIQDIMDGTVTAAGVWNLPVCKGVTAQWNWYMFSNGDGYANLKPYYPCGAVS